jgi:NAD(P)-dependent dehydrogenase (short-subunit alcohol dehydrogenase family)
MADCDRFVQLLLDKHGGVDFLINNAGRSIRRAIESATTASTTSSARCS